MNTLLAFLLALASTSGVAQSVPQKTVTLQDLTVPQERLPDGCHLKAIAAGSPGVSAASNGGRQIVRVGGSMWSMQPEGITTNPWIGTDRKVVAWLRGHVDSRPSRPLPDAFPTKREESARASQLASGVEEGYAATYEQQGARDLDLQAVRFAVTPEPRFDFSGRETGNAIHVEIGSTWILLHGDGGACSKAIEGYLRSLKK